MRDARRGEIYFSIYESTACSVTRLSDYLALAPEQVASTLNDISDERPLLFVGDAITKYGEALALQPASKVTLAPASMWAPRPGTVASIGRRMIQDGKAADLDSIEPMYVRPSEAERMALRHLSNGAAEDKKNE
jgi:tRNA threonylcarbamoyladenosine biosynthesis protein TsaB